MKTYKIKFFIVVGVLVPTKPPPPETTPYTTPTTPAATEAFPVYVPIYVPTLLGRESKLQIKFFQYMSKDWAILLQKFSTLNNHGFSSLVVERMLRIN